MGLRGLFKAPVDARAMSLGTSTAAADDLGGLEPSLFDFPSTVDYGGTDGDWTMFESVNETDVNNLASFQQVAAADVGHIAWHNPEDGASAGPQDTHAELLAGPGGQSLIAPRDVGGVTGTARLAYSADGPVTGAGTVYNNTRAAMYTETPGAYGPVVGGSDYSQTATRAYFQREAAAFSQQASEIAMLAAI